MGRWVRADPGGFQRGRLEKWAERRGLTIVATSDDQRVPASVVALRDGASGPWLLTGKSMDSVNTAAIYLVNTLERLGVDLDA